MTRSEPNPATAVPEGATGRDPSALPEGTLVRSRVESDPAVPLATALDRELTGYAVFEPQDALLLDADGAGVVGFEAGVPRFAYHTGTERGGPAALTDLVAPGPYDVEIRALSNSPTETLAGREHSDCRIPPGMAADRLGGDTDLAERTRSAAPSEWFDDGDADEGGELDAVEAFLEDEEQIAAIREQAREEARERAEQWGLDGELE